MKTVLRSLLLAFALFAGALLPSGPAWATCGDGASTCFWIPGGGAANWSATTNWSATSGGASCTCTPATGDSVTIDANSGTNGSTINANISLANFDASAASTLTLTHNTAITLTITSNTFKFGTNLTYTPASTTSLVKFTSTSGTTAITSNAKRFGAVTLDGVAGTFQPQDNFRADAVTGCVLTLTNGTFDAATVGTINVTAQLFNTANTNTRALKLGSGTWTLSGVGSVWNISSTTTTGLTYTQGTAGIVISGNSGSTSTATFLGAGLTYTSVSVTGGNGNPAVLFQGTGNTIATFSITAPAFVQVNTGQTLNITNAFTLNGASGTSVVHLESGSTSGGTGTISVTSGSPTFSFAAIRGMTFTGGATFTATNSFDLGGNVGIAITAPVTGTGGGHVIGG